MKIAISIGGTKHVKLIAGGAARAINRGASGFDNLITVDSDASLELGGDLPLIIDGKKGVPYTATAALIIVHGTFKMSSDAVTLTNNKNNSTGSTGSGVHVAADGVFTMSGGSIIGNEASNYGGGVVVNSSSQFTMSGGSITGNTASRGGSSLYKVGGTAKYGGAWGTRDILQGMYTDERLPYPNSRNPSPAPVPAEL